MNEKTQKPMTTDVAAIGLDIVYSEIGFNEISIRDCVFIIFLTYRTCFRNELSETTNPLGQRRYWL